MKFMILPSLLALAACTSEQGAVHYTYVPTQTPGGRLCTTQCAEAKDYCMQTCSLRYRQCAVDVQSQALQDYDRYTVEQFHDHQPIELRVSDFERMTTCDASKKECENACEEHHRSCYTDCGGVVHQTTSCVAFCF